MGLPLRGAVDVTACREHELLQRALVVVLFSPVLKIADPTGAGIAAFQDAVRGIYPQLDCETEQSIDLEFSPEKGMQPSIRENLQWNLCDEASEWIATLTSQSIALSAGRGGYKSRTDFSARVRYLVEAVQQHFAPAQALRIGVRYVDAAFADGSVDPRGVCAPELVSISGELTLAESDLLWRFPVDEGTLILRSGIVAEGKSYDPQMMPPAPARFWYLDIDIFSEPKTTFSTDVICDAIDRQLLRIYDIYRWALPTPIGTKTK